MLQNNVVIFTVHKAASSLVFNIMRNVSHKHGVPLFSPNITEGEYSLIEKRKNNTQDDREFRDQPCLVGPIRRPKTFTNLPNHKTIIHLRDPRDIMTSMFFSWSYSHKGIDDAKRQEWIDMGIDRFVLDMHGDMLERFRIYCDWIEADDRILLSTYEDLYDDFEGWLNRFFGFIGIEDRDLAKKIGEQNDPQKIFERGEDRDSHTRQARPGDHAQKLTGETIELLNEKFSFYFDLLERTKAAR